MTARLVLILVNAIGGMAVLVSYYQGLSSPHAASGAIWGGVPESARALYTTAMLCAAAGYFPFTYLFLFGSDPERSGRIRLPLFYLLVLIPSALWLPLTDAYLDAPAPGRWWMVKLVLLATAAGSLGLLRSIPRVRPEPAPLPRRLAIVGCVAFCFQTIVLDAAIWVILFPT
jgi:hypothetical protein